MVLIHHISENLILNQGCSQKYKNYENIYVDNNDIIILYVLLVNGITFNKEDSLQSTPTFTL